MRNYKLHLIRHGITQGNLRGAFVGCGTDIPLCEQGIEQLRDLQKEYRYPQVEAVYASPLLRCLQTAEILYPDWPVTPVPDLQEIFFGDFEDKTVAELKHHPDYRRWMDSFMAIAPPGGESGGAFQERIERGLEEVFKNMMDRDITQAAVVVHGGVIASLLYALGLPQREYMHWAAENGRGHTIAMSTQMWMRSRKVEVLEPLPLGIMPGDHPSPGWAVRLEDEEDATGDEGREDA